MIALPFRGNSTEQGNRTAGTSWSSIEGNRKPCSSRGTIPATSTCWKTACQEKKKKQIGHDTVCCKERQQFPYLRSRKVKRSDPFSLPNTEETQPQWCVKRCAPWEKKEKGLLKQAQQRAMKMSKGLEYLTYEESMKESALFSQEKRRLRYCLFLFLHLYVYLIGRKKEQDCFQLSGQDKMQWAQTEILGMLFKHKKMLFHSKGGQTLEQVAHRGSEILHLGDSKPNWSQPWAPLFEQGVGVGALQRSFPTLFSVWYALIGLSCQISIYFKNINEFSLITLLKGDNYAHSNNAHLKSEAEQRKAKEHLKSPKQDKSWHSYINN